jgi:hypothetical protein
LPDTSLKTWLTGARKQQCRLQQNSGRNKECAKK